MFRVTHQIEVSRSTGVIERDVPEGVAIENEEVYFMTGDTIGDSVFKTLWTELAVIHSGNDHAAGQRCFVRWKTWDDVADFAIITSAQAQGINDGDLLALGLTLLENLITSSRWAKPTRSASSLRSVMTSLSS